MAEIDNTIRVGSENDKIKRLKHLFLSIVVILVLCIVWFFAAHMKRLRVTAIGNSSISEAQRQEPSPLILSQISGNPPMPSNKLAIVAGLS